MKALETALYDLLRNDATLQGFLGSPARVHNSKAPEGETFPYLVFSSASLLRQRVLGGGTVAWGNFVYLIKAVDQNESKERALDIAGRVDALLEGQTLTVAGKPTLTIERAGRVSYPEDANGLRYWHEGGEYRIGVP